MYDKLIKLFLYWNTKINLSAIRNYNEVKVKHIMDSLQGLKVIDKIGLLNSNIDVVDVGTGSGFPLLPLAIEKKDWNFVGIEARKKKVLAINNIIKDLGLTNVNVIRERAEKYTNHKFDILTARAVAYIDKLLKNVYHLVKPGGYFLLYKIKSDSEYSDLLKCCKKYGLVLFDIYFYKLFDSDIERVIYVLKKI